MQYDADVIIAGAGPAGSMAAWELAREGADVLILEKSTFPRYKVCGGGLTRKIVDEMPFPLSPVIEREIRSVRFSCHFTDQFTRTSPGTLIFCTMRDHLDRYLLDRAVEAGARIRFSEHLSSLQQDQQGVTVQTRTGSFRSRMVIGADGASSMVAHASGLRKDLVTGMAWEAEMDAGEAELEKFGHTVFLDWGTFPGGYGWIFPKQDHFSVGVGGPASLSRHLEPYNQRFLESSDIRFTGIRTMKAWPIPVKTRKGDFHSGLVMVAGDAAGLTDPLTGEGISYAVRSGIMAGRAAWRSLQGTTGALRDYSDNINQIVMPEILEAHRVKAIFNAVPLTIHRSVQSSDRVWRAFGKILTGERTYFDVRRGFGRWRFLWGAACGLAELVYWVRVRKSREGKRRVRRGQEGSGRGRKGH